MSDGRIQWYSGGLGRTNKGQVSIERQGNIAIGHDLLAEWPEGCGRARLGRDAETCDIVIQPTEDGGPDTLAVQMPKSDRRAARIASAAALKSWGLRIEKAQACTARWRDGLLWLTLPAVPDISRATGAEPLSPEAAPEEPRAHSGETPAAVPEPPVTAHEPPVTAHEPPVPVPEPRVVFRPARRCENCTWQKFRLCTCSDSPRANRNVSLDGTCDSHFYTLPLRGRDEKDPRPERPHSSLTPTQLAASRVVPQTGRTPDAGPARGKFGTGPTGSRPRAKCPIADHDGRTFTISKRGLAIHDQNGRSYQDLDFDKTKICPGSGARG